ncbi:hypothetical protein HPP92_022294 [Vanilla planifolia]|uniref:Uncharacterized protein n=1 Tax=Vanilla planifolia TaxID=51239 RepID=A0A835PW86_VANPL|nr:hypothetical protein HPP92_022294 [Vanilla planifolia]
MEKKSDGVIHNNTKVISLITLLFWLPLTAPWNILRFLHALHFPSGSNHRFTYFPQVAQQAGHKYRTQNGKPSASATRPTTITRPSLPEILGKLATCRKSFFTNSIVVRDKSLASFTGMA